MLTLSRAIKRDASRHLAVVAPVAADEPAAQKVEDLRGRIVCNSERQFAFLNDYQTHTFGLIGGIGAGKSWALARSICTKQFIERGRGTVGGLFANTYEQLTTATLPHLWAIYEQLGMEYGRDYVYNEAPPRYWRGFKSKFKKRFTNVVSVREWGQMITRSLDKYENIRGIELGFAGLDELRGAKEAALDVVLGRLRCKLCSRILVRYATSPNGFDWVYERLVEGRGKDRNHDRRKVVFVRTIDNAANLKEGYVEDLLDTYDPKMAQQELEGKFVLMTAGMVYHQFSRQVHVGRFSPSPDLDWQVCFDFNRTPYSVILCQTVRRAGKRDRVYAIDEVILTDAGTPEACAEIFRRLDAFGARAKVEVFGDPTGRRKDTRSNHSDYDIITREFSAKYGSAFAAEWDRQHKPTMNYINAVNAMLRNAAGDVALMVNERCKSLRRDFERVSYKEGSADVDKITDKRLTHASDALGYFIERRYPIRHSEGGIAIL